MVFPTYLNCITSDSGGIVEYMPFLNVLAHGGEEVLEVVGPTLDQVIRSNSIKFSLLAGGVVLILTILSVLLREKSTWLKYILFGGFIIVILANTIYLSASTIYLNQQSTTGGPVHYHADFEIWNCGQKVEIKDPEGLSNKVGTEVVHEHNDDRIHIEGVILDKHDASLGHFFESIGGKLHKDHMSIPAENGLLELETGQICNGERGILQVFVYKTDGRNFSQRKVNDPQNYIISPHSQVPPGDCVIIEFDKEKERTEKVCNFYKIAIQKGELVER